jgi:hypothetical protein
VAYQNPSNVLVRTRHADAHLHVKVAGFGQPAISATVTTNPCIWYAPEVWGGGQRAKCTEEADVYSFEMLTGNSRSRTTTCGGST